MSSAVEAKNIHWLPTRHRVLVISDRPLLSWEAAHAIGVAQAEQDGEVFVAHSVDAAQNLAASLRPDLIVADIAFLNRSTAGLELAALLDRLSQSGRTRLALVSGERDLRASFEGKPKE